MRAVLAQLAEEGEPRSVSTYGAAVRGLPRVNGFVTAAELVTGSPGSEPISLLRAIMTASGWKDANDEEVFFFFVVTWTNTVQIKDHRSPALHLEESRGKILMRRAPLTPPGVLDVSQDSWNSAPRACQNPIATTGVRAAQLRGQKTEQPRSLVSWVTCASVYLDLWTRASLLAATSNT